MDLKNAHIWAATFDNSQEKESIFHERYDDDEKSINAFAKSQCEWSYDHDLFFIDGFEAEVEQLFVGEISANNREVIVKKWKAKVPNNFKSVVVADSDDFEKPMSCKIGKSEFIYLGAFPFFGR